jgi:hypothetical protein
MWASGRNGDTRRAAHGYEPTREARWLSVQVEETRVALRQTGSVATAMAIPAKKALMQQSIRKSSTLVMTPSDLPCFFGPRLA